jgi:6-phospho-beta-glucosidase
MGIEAGLLQEYREPARTQPPPTLSQRGGAYYSTVATQFINAHHNDLGETQTVNVPHGGAVRSWDPSWVLEMPARIGRDGVRPLPADPLPLALQGLMVQVKMYELLTVEAAVTADRDLAYQALLAHPLGPSAGAVQDVLEDLLATNRQHLPRWEVTA